MRIGISVRASEARTAAVAVRVLSVSVLEKSRRPQTRRFALLPDCRQLKEFRIWRSNELALNLQSEARQTGSLGLCGSIRCFRSPSRHSFKARM